MTEMTFTNPSFTAAAQRLKGCTSTPEMLRAVCVLLHCCKLLADHYVIKDFTFYLQVFGLQELFSKRKVATANSCSYSQLQLSTQVDVFLCGLPGLWGSSHVLMKCLKKSCFIWVAEIERQEESHSMPLNLFKVGDVPGFTLIKSPRRTSSTRALNITT